MNLRITFFFFLASLLCLTETSAQAFQGLDEAPHDIAYYRESRVAPPLVKVVYGRPQKNGEKVFGNLVPFGKVWRTGANEATEVKFYKDVVFGGVNIPAGTYVIYTVPGENEWEVILSSKLDVLGSFQYNPFYNMAKILVPVTKAEELETFSIAFKNNENRVNMVLGWDVTRVSIPLGFTPSAAVVSM